MMPAPSHLKGLAKPLEDCGDDRAFSSPLTCSCGSQSFEILYPGQTVVVGGRRIPCTAEIDGQYFFVVASRCARCGDQQTLLDVDFHGWNGWLCHDPVQAALPRPPLVVWPCENCGGTAHHAAVHISGEGRADFVLEAGPEFDPDRWADGFGWFELNLGCDACDVQSPGLISYETM